jgi:hypothetical protein
MHFRTKQDLAAGVLYRTEATGSAGLGLALCLGLALALRLPGTDAASLWADELASWTFTRLAWSDLLGAIARVEPNPPGYYLLLKAWTTLFGDGTAMLRLPSVLAGALAVLPLALVARAEGGRAAGLLTALLVATSAMQIHHAQQARGYALLFLAGATALALLGPMLHRSIAPRRRAGATAGFVLACLVMLHLHATATVAVAALFVQAAVVLAARWRWGEAPGRASLLALLAAAALIALGAAWWLRLALAIAADPGAAITWIERPTLADTAGILADLLGGFHLGRLKLLAAAAMALTLLAGAALAWRGRRAEPLGLAAAFAFGLAALHALSQVKPMLLDRTALVLLVFALPLAGIAAAAIRPRAVGIGLGVVLVALALRGTSSRAAAFAAEGFGEDWRGAVTALARQAAPGDLVVMLNPPDSGAVALHAPGLAPRIRLRARVVPEDRLSTALVARLPDVAPLAPGEGCGAPAWTLGRETRWELAAIAAWPPPQDPPQRFGGVVLRRRALPC